MIPSRPLIPTVLSRLNLRRNAVILAGAVLLPLGIGACSSDEASEEPATTAAASQSASSGAADATSAPAETTASADTPVATDAASTDGGGGGGCSAVPSKEDVESIIGSTVLPVEDQGTAGCAYLGDGDNVGVYFEIETDEFEIQNFDNPDPQFATIVEDPGLPPGSFVQSGDFYAKKNDVLYKVVAGVTGTEDDDQLATQLMIAWLALVP